MARLLKKLNWYLVGLGTLLIIAFFLRTVDLENNPKGIYGDGLTLVYDAYSLLHTGMDQKGNPWPFIFQMGDHRPPGYVYATIPFTALFGPTVWAANAVSILSGLGVIILVFLLGKQLYSERVGLSAAFLATFSSWELSLSRGPFETHFALFLTILGVYSYLRSKLNSWWLVLASFSFGIASITYPTYGLTAPLLFIFLIIVDNQRQDWYKKHLKISLGAGLISLVFLLSSIQIAYNPADPTRAQSINIFNRPEVKAQIEQKIISDRLLNSGPEELTNNLHNYYWEYGALVFENYIENFRPTFLIIDGDLEPRHNPAEIGQLYWAYGILIIIGFAFIYGTRPLTLLLGWILIAPLATSVISPPHALRDSLMLPPLLLLAAFGVEKVLRSKRWFKRLVIAFILVLFLAEFTFFVDRFFFIAPNKFSRYWAQPAKEAAFKALENKASYDYVLISSRIDNAEFAYPVYAKLEPERVIAQNKNNTQLGEYKFVNFDNVYIGSIPEAKIQEFMASLPGSVLYLGPATDLSFVESPQTISGPDLLPALVVSQKR